MTDVQTTSTSEVKTVLTDPKEFNVLHPLNSQWTLWFDNPGRKTNVSSWTQNLKEIISVDTVEDFWGVYNNIPIASDLPNGSNYHFFRKGIKPMWEDTINANGGKWGYQFMRTVGEKVNELWMNTLIACIGEAFESSDDVCGAVFSNRKNGFRVAVWTRNAKDKETCEAIGRHLKKILSINSSLEYVPHNDNLKGSSKVLYTV